MTTGPTDDDRLEEILADHLERAEAGTAGPPAALAAEYPEFAAELADFFAVRNRLDAAVAPLRAAASAPAAAGVGRLGDFRLLREVGRGGMGVVYEAEQISLGRRVALKVLPFAATLDPRQLQRFKNEALAAAALDHPHVVDVYGVGCERGVHYYAMRFVDGHSLAEVVDQLRRPGAGPVPDSVARAFADPAPSTAPVAQAHTRRSAAPRAYPRSVAEVGLRVAEALDHAHRQGVVHRDVKPSNLLLDTQGKVWVADFGLARLESAESVTGTGNLVGTLRYMAPEKAVGPGPADHRVDVYGLGATLYELLTLRPAFPGGDREELLRQIAADPPAPRRLDGSIPADLETVVLKAMSRAPADRYPTAGALADDLRRFLEDRPVQARRPGPAARLRRWARRHRPAVLAAGTGLGLLLVLAVGGLVAGYRAVTRERDQTRSAEREVQVRVVDALMERARAGRSSREAGHRLDSWKAVAEAARRAGELGLGEDRRMDLRNEAIACLALADVRLERRWAGHPPGSTDRPAFDPDLDHFARSDRRGNVSVRRVADDDQVRLLEGFARKQEETGAAESGAAYMWFSPDGSRLAVQYYLEPDRTGSFRLWDWRAGRVLLDAPFVVTHMAVAFRPDGRLLALGHDDRKVTFHDPATGAEAAEPLHLAVDPMHLAYSPDGTRLAVTSFAGRKVLVLDPATGAERDAFGLPHGAWTAAWHPGGALLAVGCEDHTVHLRDTVSRRSHAGLRGHHGGPTMVGFAAGGDLLVSSAWDGSTRVWDPWAGHELVRFPGMARQVSRDGRRVACEAGWNVTVWEVTPSPEYRTLPRARAAGGEGVWGGGLSPDGRWLALATATGVRLWDLARRTEVDVPPSMSAWDVQFHPRRPEMLAAGAGGVFRWPLQQHGDVLRVGPAERLSGPARRIALDGVGRRLAAADGRGGWVLNPDDPAATVRRLGHPLASAAVLSPNGRWAATGSHKGLGLRVWDADTGRPLGAPLLPDEWGTQPVFSSDDRWLAAITPGVLCVWRTDTWELVQQVHRSEDFTRAAFSPDGRQLAAALPVSGVELIDPATGELRARLHAPDLGPVAWIGFHPDGGQLLTATAGGEVHVWDLRRIREQLREIGLDWDPGGDLPAAGRHVGPPVTRVEFVADR
jgi:serine/threonine protein kinase/WD40 repeat protein